MHFGGFWLLLFGLCSVQASTYLTERVEVARCRVKCLKFLPGKKTDMKCAMNSDCIMRPGCQEACTFWNTAEDEEIPQNSWMFRGTPKVKALHENIHRVTWKPPRPVVKTGVIPEAKHIVYVLFKTTHTDPAFTEVSQSISPKTEFVDDGSLKETSLRVVAVNVNGTVAEIDFVPIETANRKEIVIKPELNVTVEKRSDQTLVILLKFKRWTSYNGRAPSMYYVTWQRETCNTNETYPYCDLPSDRHESANTDEKEVMYAYLPNATYNSEYVVFVEQPETKVRQSIKVSTPGCAQPDSTFTKCLGNQLYRWYPNLTSVGVDNNTKIVATLTWPLMTSGQPVFYRVHSWPLRDEGETPIGSPLEGSLHNTTHNTVRLAILSNTAYQVQVNAVYQRYGKTAYNVSEILNIDPVNISLASNEQTEDVPESTRQPSTESISDVVMPIFIATVISVIVSALIVVIVIKWIRIKKQRQDNGGELRTVCDEWEVNSGDLTVGAMLGEGAFGCVRLGMYRNKQVAVKTLKDLAPTSTKDEFLAEITLMKKVGQHPNIVSLIGAITQGEQLALLMEFMPKGNLLNFIRKYRQDGRVRQASPGSRKEIVYSQLNQNGRLETCTLKQTDILLFARQIAMAMEYLSSQQIIHRDLAARNALVGDNNVVKLCDFGLSRDVFVSHKYQKMTPGRLPLKWMALESLKTRTYTTETDVWSYGVLLWEIATLGSSPYPDVPLALLHDKLAAGHRMSKPDNCHSDIYDIMSSCWCENPTSRPTFREIRQKIEDLMESDTHHYLELENITTPILDSEDDLTQNEALEVLRRINESWSKLSEDSSQELTDQVAPPHHGKLTRTERFLSRSGTKESLQSFNSSCRSSPKHASVTSSSPKHASATSSPSRRSLLKGKGSNFSSRSASLKSFKGSFKKKSMRNRGDHVQTKDALLRDSDSDDEEGFNIDPLNFKRKLEALQSTHC